MVLQRELAEGKTEFVLTLWEAQLLFSFQGYPESMLPVQEPSPDPTVEPVPYTTRIEVYADAVPGIIQLFTDAGLFDEAIVLSHIRVDSNILVDS